MKRMIMLMCFSLLGLLVMMTGVGLSSSKIPEEPNSGYRPPHEVEVLQPKGYSSRVVIYSIDNHHYAAHEEGGIIHLESCPSCLGD